MLHIYYAKCGREERWVIRFYSKQIRKQVAWLFIKVSGIISGLNAIVLDRAERNNKARVLAQYLVDNLNTHNIWAIKIFITEIIYFLNVLLNLYFIDVFLGT